MEVLEIMNPWWKENSISSDLAPPYKRKAFESIKKLLDVKPIVMISGLRRVGKSRLMYQVIELLLKSNIKPKNILYFSFDEKKEDLFSLLEEYGNLAKTEWRKEKCYIFLDEIQKLENWSNRLKVIYDTLPNLKIFISGSASFDLERGASKNLAGRRFEINVPPLSFDEYLDLKKSKIDRSNTKLWGSELEKEFENYKLKPYPELVHYTELSLIKSYIKTNIIDKILRDDLSSKFKDVNEELLTLLVELFFSTPGMYANYDTISSSLKVSKKTLLKHIYYLEYAYIIRRIKNYRPSTRSTSRKLQRIYPYHFSLNFGWNGKINAEVIAVSYFDSRYYWREEGKEVDILDVSSKGIIPIEVKESGTANLNELSSLTYFMNKFNIDKAMLVYSGEEGELSKGKLKIKVIPLWLLFLLNQEKG